MMGDWVLFVGLPFEIYRLTGSTLATGGMVLAMLVPRIVLGSVAGVYVDRWDRRRLMIMVNLLLAAVPAARCSRSTPSVCGWPSSCSWSRAR